MKIITRYIIREAAANFMLCIFAFTGILLTLRMLRFAALVIDKGVALEQIGIVFVSIIPTFLEIAIPLSTLLGIMLAFARMSGDSEIVVMRGSGISLYQLISPVLAFGVWASLAGFIVSHDLKPWGYQTLSETLFDIARTKTTAGLEQGIFNKLGPLTLYAEKISPQNGNLERVLIDDRRDESQRKVVLAKTGSIASDTKQRSIILNLEQGSIHETIEGKYGVTNFTSNRLVFNPEELLQGENKQVRTLNELSEDELILRKEYLSQLLNKVALNEKVTIKDYSLPLPPSITAEESSIDGLRRKLIRTQIEHGQRYSLPCASLVLALMALSLGIQPSRAQRTWGIGLSAMLGMLVFVLYYGLLSLGMVVAQNGIISATVCIWLPNIVVALLAVFLLQRTASERWQSVADTLHQCSLSLLSLFFSLFKRTENTKKMAA